MIGSALLVTGMALTAPAHAQMGAGMMGGQMGAGTTGQKAATPEEAQMSDIIRDWSRQMDMMSQQMAKGGMSTAQRKHMAAQMRQMSTMMMSIRGMMLEGMTRNPNMHKQMADMRRQMDEMMTGSQ